jgi:hypothetical protein
MILGCMQPYFFPYIGYFDLINRCDTWVVFDTPKYGRRQWMNRNRILRPDWSWQYITAPVARRSSSGSIEAVRVLDKQAALQRILGQLEHYKPKKAPFFFDTVNLVERCFAITTGDSLVELTVNSLRVVCDHLAIAFAPVLLSQAKLPLPEIHEPGEWALEISAAMGASDYVNAPGGGALFDPEAFAARGIRLHVAELIDFKFSCGDHESIDHLSIIDVLMWNGPEKTKAKLDQVKFQWLQEIYDGGE